MGIRTSLPGFSSCCADHVPPDDAHEPRTPNLEPRTAYRSTWKQVIVVGAGIAGITAAKELRRKGWPSDKVVLLEASADIGGRVSPIPVVQVIE